MNLELFIANRIKAGGVSGKKLAGPVISVATIGVALGLAVMIISVAVGIGFKKEIRQKVIGFGSHIQVMSYDYNLSYEVNPISNDSAIVQEINRIPGVAKVQRFISKPGIIKTPTNVHGLVLKGVGSDYDWQFFNHILVKGNVLKISDDSLSNSILISEKAAEMLNLTVGDDVPMYFLQQTVRGRKFTVTGIFNSGLPEFDELFAIVDLRHIQKLNGWKPSQIAGYEITINDFDNIDEIASQIQFITSQHIDPDGIMLRTRTIVQAQPQIFSWLNILDTNIAVIIILILLVAGLNMISGLLILILERTNMIGVLKSMGTTNKSLRKIFLYMAIYIIGRGLLWGNIIGVGLCLIQKYTGIISLDPVNYYLDKVPISLSLFHLVLINIGSLLSTTFMLFGPSYIVSKISPAKAIRFD